MIRATSVVVTVTVVVVGSIACGSPSEPREPQPRTEIAPAPAPAKRPLEKWTVDDCPDLLFASRDPSRSACRWSEEEPGTLEIEISAGAQIWTTGAWPERIRLVMHSTGDAVRVKAGGRDCGWSRGQTEEQRQKCAPDIELREVRAGANDYGLEWIVDVASSELGSSNGIETEWIIYWVMAEPVSGRGTSR